MEKQHSDDGSGVKRRRLLKLSGAAVGGGLVVPGVATANGRNGQGGGPPFLEPTDGNVVFCGCSQVCVCEVDCTYAEVIIAGAPNETIDQHSCLESNDGQILAVDDGMTKWCNPNTACADFERAGLDRDDCDEIGTAPQFGARCGDAFLREEC